MARPTTKTALITAANEQFDKIWKLINSLTDAEQNAAFNFGNGFAKKEAHWKRDKNLRDILIHLHEWHKLLLNWVNANRNDKVKPFLPEPYSWKTYGDMNVEFWKKHQTTGYTDSKAMLCKSHKAVLDLIETFSDKELFEKKHFNWTGTSSLGSYCISAMSGHYDWAIKKIKLHIKHLKV
ncbi:ClbS/DfsB family four-helix bundle protein [Endomicrobium proavitum]|uniref:ClbS/DfsB family four-helix bundle protein n=1 Tax=Endomicrobium proavitum TaxID=1408281 RepID=A0A0G3WJU7_9BACT|nr:ClbS/DfsB family four-helix bundle protein [Endomicrobium proavitum]AKL98160.1 hypothetical protein Epro_0781 [Endomicrobium proavitum]